MIVVIIQYFPLIHGFIWNRFISLLCLYNSLHTLLWPPVNCMVKCRNFSNYILVIGCSEFGDTVGYIKTQEFVIYINLLYSSLGKVCC